MKKSKILGVALLAFGALTFTSCNNDDDINTDFNVTAGSVSRVVGANGDLSTLNTALSAGAEDLTTTLDGDGPFTLFAPSNAAFAAFAADLGFEDQEEEDGGATAVQQLLDAVDGGVLSNILKYHVVPGDFEAGVLTDGLALPTAFEGSLNVDKDGDAISVSGDSKMPNNTLRGNVVLSNNRPTNGVVHIIDRVLLPQSAIDAIDFDTRPTLLDYAVTSDNLTTLVAALTKTGLVGTIGGLKAANVLAPTNDAFGDLLEALGDDYNSLDDFDNDFEMALLSNILTYHVLPAAEGEEAVLVEGTAATAFSGNTVDVIANGDGFAFNDATAVNANTIVANLEAKNGFAQVIDKVLLPQAGLDFIALLASDDLADLVIATPTLSILEEALVAAELVTPFVDDTNESFVQGAEEEDDAFETRRTPANFTFFKAATVFAPSDDAFGEFFDLLGDDYNSIADFDTDDEKALLTEILLYHVLEGEVTSDALANGMSATLLADSSIEIIKVVGSDNTFVIGDESNQPNANIVAADVQARNGVAHVIDKVLLPQSAVNFIEALGDAEEED